MHGWLAEVTNSLVLTGEHRDSAQATRPAIRGGPFFSIMRIARLLTSIILHALVLNATESLCILNLHTALLCSQMCLIINSCIWGTLCMISPIVS